MCGSLQVSFFFLLQIPKYSQNDLGLFSFITQFITAHCLPATRDQIELTHSHAFILAACTLFSLQVREPSAWPLFMGPSLSCPSAAVHSASIAAPAGRHRTTGGEGKRLRTHLSLVERQDTSGWGGEGNKGSSSSASPSAFIANNLLSVCDAAVLPLFPRPSFSPAQMGPTRRRRGRGSARKGRSGALCCDRSDPEVFSRLMNGTFEVFSLAWCPKPASPVVGVNWPVVWPSGTVPGSLPDNSLSVAAQSRATITFHLKNHQLTPAHNDPSIHCLPKRFPDTTNTCSPSRRRVLALLMADELLADLSGAFL